MDLLVSRVLCSSRFVLCVSLAFGAFAQAFAQAPPPLSQPSFPLITNGEVLAMARMADGRIVVGGTFTTLGGASRSNIALLRADGTLDPDWNPGTDGAVMALAVTKDGTVFAGGTFEHAGGLSHRYIAKFFGAGVGAVDALWDPLANQAVQALAVGDADTLFAGGEFEGFGSGLRRHIAKLSTLGSGELDPNWNPGADSFVTQLLTNGDALYVGGEFTTLGGVTRRYLAKLSVANAVVDAGWDPAPLGYPYALAADVNYVYVGGTNMSMIGGQPRDMLARISTTSGLADPAWDPQPDGIVSAIGLDPGGAVYVGGNFLHIGSAPHTHVARLDPIGAGTADSTWTPTIDDSGMLDAGFGSVRSMIADGKVLHTGGNFTLVNGETRLGLAAISNDGTVLVPMHAGRAGSVYAVARQSTGAVIVGGDFYAAGSIDPSQAPPSRHA